MSVVLDALFLLTAWGHVFLAPFTKVEESFSLHATHDVLMYGVLPGALPNYDHFTFPGAVPRTFIGSLLLAWISTPVLYLASIAGFEASKVDVQVTVRLVLATFNAISCCLLRRAVARRFGSSTSVFFTLLSCTQFHVPFWMGRTIPNMFALITTNIAMYLLMNRAPKSARPHPSVTALAFSLLTFTAIVLRAEVALLVVPLALQYLLVGGISFFSLIKVGGLTAVASIAATTLVDSYFWQKFPLWPELHSILFNVVEGKSADWGVSPFREYFTTHLPKMLLTAAPLSLVGLFSDARIRALLLPVVLFVLALSSLAHKEWRFIVYAVPLFNVAAARGAAWIVGRRRRWLGRLGLLFVTGLLAVNCGLTYAFTRISMENYPGGSALVRFNEIYAGQPDVHVHLSNLAAQTGASLFLQTHTPPYILSTDTSQRHHDWTYDKTENLTSVSLTASPEITHLIAECPDYLDAKNKLCDVWREWPEGQWRFVETVKAFSGWSVSPTAFGSGLLQVFDMIVMVKNDALVILERK
ncbi:dolichyl-P-Man:Man(7)GlcNAc(2)-PP-dolichol alpha-1,6-mannosyltransferase [Steccherinum ochraceum]|uniref:Mannosyltransferase n=1 Tax=Steccherinum ochraceum TaxID=92696 RepID=A0A4R0R4V2_9APHY|nr:dolichyl-P-Man:Man(7)GlcNAc(2)-PP-dolichol alpha-1,6-mannosyltransferase [Steccherinum ochraceum]